MRVPVPGLLAASSQPTCKLQLACWALEEPNATSLEEPIQSLHEVLLYAIRLIRERWKAAPPRPWKNI